MSLVIIWAISFFYYVKNLDKDNQKSENESLNSKNEIMQILLISTVLIMADIPFKIVFNLSDGLYVIYGPATIIIYIMVSILIVFLFVTLFRSKYPNYLKTPIYLIIFMFVMDTGLTLSKVITDINDIPFFLSLFMIALYFTIESQDRLLLEELEKATEEANKANVAKTEFLSNMSHEIRTPMNTILGFSQSMLKEDKLDKRRIKQDTESIHEASIVLLDLINNILDISRIESNKEELCEKEYLLSELLLELNNAVNSRTMKSNTKLLINVNKKMPNKFYGDSSKIYKILSSLILYVIKYSGDGDIILNVDYKNAKQNLNFISFVIYSTSQIGNEDVFKIDFDNYLTLSKDSQNVIDSEKIGIVISKRLLKIINNGSSLEFKSNDDHGTEYIVKISQRIVEQSPIGNISFDSEKKDYSLICSGKKVLIVDDNKMNLKISTKIFKDYEFNVETAESGKECIEKLKHEKYDIIFLDHMMPDVDGINTLHILKSQFPTLPPIVALTANSDSSMKEKYINEGFDDYLSKPINVQKLNKIIIRYFKQED